MQVGAISSQPFIYNTNQVNAASMNKVRPIPSDVTAERTDYSGLADKNANTNKLRPGETADFAAIVEEQMSRAERVVDRVMKADEKPAPEEKPPVEATKTEAPKEDVVVEKKDVEATPERDIKASEDTAKGTSAPDPREEATQTITSGKDNINTEMAKQVNETAVKNETEPKVNEAITPVETGQNTPAAINATVTDDGTVSAKTREAMGGTPLENFQISTPVSGNELTGGKAFNNVIPEGLERPLKNVAIDYAEEKAKEPTLADRLQEANQEKQENPANIYQMQRATQAYALAMGF